jgi:crossover junction endodeoxyribonuclease RuvC
LLILRENSINPLNNLQKKRIIGIDPGTNVLGFAVIEVQKPTLHLVDIGVLTMQHFEVHHEKLKYIFEQIQDIITQHAPQEMAIEAPFFGKNVQAMLKLGRAQGVAIAAGLTKGLLIQEYSPKTIKQSVTGNGNSSKEQVAAMLQQIMKIKLQEVYLDATDALATAVCHHYQSDNRAVGVKSYSGWAGFLKANADKIKK